MTTMNIPRKDRQPPEQDLDSVSPKSEAALNLNIGKDSFDPLTRHCLLIMPRKTVLRFKADKFLWQKFEEPCPTFVSAGSWREFNSQTILIGQNCSVVSLCVTTVRTAAPTVKTGRTEFILSLKYWRRCKYRTYV
jgi:hypothetical protein